MHDLYIAEIDSRGHFLLGTVWVGLHSILDHELWNKAVYGEVVHYSRSRSLKLVPNGYRTVRYCVFKEQSKTDR